MEGHAKSSVQNATIKTLALQNWTAETCQYEKKWQIGFLPMGLGRFGVRGVPPLSWGLAEQLSPPWVGRARQLATIELGAMQCFD